jgi:hypothetical protein
MTQNVKDKLLMCLRRTAIAIFAIGAIAGTVHANPPGPEEYAVLDLTRVGDPTLITVPGLTLPGRISVAGHSAFAVAAPTTDAPRAPDFGPIDAVLSYELNRIFDVKQVRTQMRRTNTGTSSMPTENGFYVIRCPALEWIHPVLETTPN